MYFKELVPQISRGAVWCWRLAFFSFCLASVGIFASRRGLEPSAVLLILSSALFFALIALPLGAAATGTIWSRGWRGTIYTVSGLLLASALLSLPAYLTAQNISRPVSANISTDLDFPPSFSLSRSAMTARGFLDPPPLSRNQGELQRKAYPAVQPLRIDLEPSGAYARVLKAAADSGWQIIESHAPGGRMGYGHIDAIARSRWLHFQYDIAIRLVPLADETLMDMRVSSRLASLDFGQNAKLIEDFVSVLRAQEEKTE